MLFAVFDTETTGLPSHFKSPLSQQPRIIEFAGIITDGKEVIDTLEFICNPGIAIEEIITKITGLTNEDLKDKPPFSNFINSLKNFFKKSNAGITHNLSFDKGMLEYDLKRCELSMMDIAWPVLELCTVEQTFPMYGKRVKLIDLYNMHGGDYVQKHRALDDVMILHEVCQRIGLYEAFYEGDSK